jgi:hypothetical protein
VITDPAAVLWLDLYDPVLPGVIEGPSSISCRRQPYPCWRAIPAPASTHPVWTTTMIDEESLAGGLVSFDSNITDLLRMSSVISSPQTTQRSSRERKGVSIRPDMWSALLSSSRLFIQRSSPFRSSAVATTAAYGQGRSVSGLSDNAIEPLWDRPLRWRMVW